MVGENPVCERLTGFSFSETQGKTIEQIFPPLADETCLYITGNESRSLAYPLKEFYISDWTRNLVFGQCSMQLLYGREVGVPFCGEPNCCEQDSVSTCSASSLRRCLVMSL